MKKLLSIVLALTMVLSFATVLPVSAAGVGVEAAEPIGQDEIGIYIGEDLADDEALSESEDTGADVEQVEPELQDDFVFEPLADDDIIDSGYCGGVGDGKNLSYVLTRDGKLTISGTGQMKNSNAGASPWYSNREIIRSVVFNGNVTSIGLHAFYGCASLTSVSIPNSVTKINNSAFANCSSITSIIIPNSVASIGTSAFSGCKSLKSITIPSNVAVIESYLLANCSSLTSVVIPDKAMSIGSSAFKNCEKLSSIAIPNGVVTIDSSAFYNCKTLKDIVIPSSVTEVGTETFRGCISLESATISNGVIKIGTRAFYDCNSLTSIAIPGSVRTIDQSAFYNCTSLASLSISDGITSVGSSVFEKCTSLKSVVIPSTLSSIGSNMFRGCTNLASVSIPNGVLEIKGYAFSDCKSLKSLTIPESVITVGSYIVRNCSSMSDIYCEVKSQPSGWDKYWNYSCPAVIHWGSTIHTHTFTNDWQSDDTNHWHECSCGEKSDVAAHTWDSGKVTKPATETETGIMTYTCTVCKKTRNETIPKIQTSSKGKVTLSNVTVAPGGTVDVTVSLTGFPKCSTVCISNISFNNSQLKLVSGKWDEEFKKNASISSEIEPGREEDVVIITFDSDREINGNIAKLRFEASNGADLRTETITAIVNTIEDSGATSTVNAEGTISIARYKRGDVNGDGILNNKDAIYLLKHVVLGSMYPITQDADMNGDGVVNNKDAIYLLKHVVLGDMYPLKNKF